MALHERYYLSSIMRKLEFKAVPPFNNGRFGDIKSNWQKGNIRVERNQIKGKTHLTVIKDGAIKMKVFDISNSNPDREKDIELFEEFINNLVNPNNKAGKIEEVVSINMDGVNLDDLAEEVGDTILKLMDIKLRLKNGKELDETQKFFLSDINLI